MNKILHYLPQITEINVELLKDFEERLENWSVQISSYLHSILYVCCISCNYAIGFLFCHDFKDI